MRKYQLHYCSCCIARELSRHKERDLLKGIGFMVATETSPVCRTIVVATAGCVYVASCCMHRCNNGKKQ